jgi:hypothetical protein
VALQELKQEAGRSLSETNKNDFNNEMPIEVRKYLF